MDEHRRSQDIGVAIRFEGPVAMVYTLEGQRQLTEGEIAVEITRLRRLLRERGMEAEREH